MLLRGVKFAAPALTRSDIEVTKGRAARSGRSHGGVPLQGNGRARNSFNYSSSNQNPPSQSRRQSYGSQNGGYNNYQVPPPGWQPPPHREQVALLEGLPHLLPAPMDMLDMDHQDILSHLGRVHNLGTAHLRITAAPVIHVEVVVMVMDMDMDMEDLVREYEFISSRDPYQPYSDNGAQFS